MRILLSERGGWVVSHRGRVEWPASLNALRQDGLLSLMIIASRNDLIFLVFLFLFSASKFSTPSMYIDDLIPDPISTCDYSYIGIAVQPSVNGNKIDKQLSYLVDSRIACHHSCGIMADPGYPIYRSEIGYTTHVF